MATRSTTGVRRYHPLIVAIHWLVALLVLGNLAAGALLLEPVPNFRPEKADLLRLHMATGITILVLMAVRLVSRIVTKAPPPPHEKGALRWLARVNHWLLYLVVFAMLSTGIGMAALGGLFPILGGEQVRLPATFEQLPPHAGHVLFATVLLVLVALHLAGVVYHTLVKKQNLLSRMWFGDRHDPQVPVANRSELAG